MHLKDLIGGGYGLLGIPHDNEALGPTDSVTLTPDFWLGGSKARLRERSDSDTHGRAFEPIRKRVSASESDRLRHSRTRFEPHQPSREVKDITFFGTGEQRCQVQYAEGAAFVVLFPAA